MPRKPRLVGGVKGHNMNETSFPGSPALLAGSFIYEVNEEEKMVTLFDFDHHDNVYKI